MKKVFGLFFPTQQSPYTTKFSLMLSLPATELLKTHLKTHQYTKKYDVTGYLVLKVSVDCVTGLESN